MTHKILMKEQIKSWVLRVLSGYCFEERRPDFPEVYILSPWIKDVRLEIDKEVRELDESWFSGVYGIASINLPYALLLLKLEGANINIITRPPTEKHYKRAWEDARTLLDFLDEIGCNVYANPDFHSKLILSNDIALLGSFNLSFSALWGREEIGVCIDDIENLRILERYAHEVISSSKPYGYTQQGRRQELAHDKRAGRELSRELLARLGEYGPLKEDDYKPIYSVTRGWLFEKIIDADSDFVEACGGFSYACHEFLFHHFKTILSYDLIKLAAPDLEAFYVSVFTTFLKSQPKERRLQLLRRLFDYQGKNEIGKILDFLKTKFARTHVPNIRPEFAHWYDLTESK